jgi:hypothetical protein
MTLVPAEDKDQAMAVAQMSTIALAVLSRSSVTASAATSLSMSRLYVAQRIRSGLSGYSSSAGSPPVGAVRYLDYQTEGGGLSNMFDFVMHKRHFYRYESEVRAVASLADRGAGRDHILANRVERSYAPPIDVKALIDEVIIHPEAKQTFRDEIADICKQHALPTPRLSGLAS